MSRIPWLRLAAVAAVISITASMPAAAGQRSKERRPRLDRHLEAVKDAGSREPQRVIIRVRPGGRADVRSALARHGDRILKEHESLDAITALVHAEDLAELGGHDTVLSVSTDARVHADGLLDGLLGIVGGLVNVVGGVVGVVGNVLLPNGADTSGEPVSPEVLRSTLGINDTTWAGRGIGVAVIDSGLEMSYEFQGRVTAFYDFTRGGVASYPYDDFGHGTHVASTIGGSGALSRDRDYRGLAPSVRFVVLKALDSTGAGWTSDVIAAVDFAVANRHRFGIDVINLSLGHPIYEPAATDPLVQAVERAVKAGIVVVAAAGNYGKNPQTGVPGFAGITSPGNAPSVITVGAIRTEDTVSRADDRIPDYSSSGPTWYDGIVKPDVVAPGHNIVAAAAKRGWLYRTYPQLRSDDGDYMRLSGTSMATAVATGSIARLLEAHNATDRYDRRPELSPNAIKAILQYTAVEVRDDAGLEYHPLKGGGGGLNSRGAADLARSINTSTPIGEWWLTSYPSPYTRIGGAYLRWSQSIIWGTAVGWGHTITVNHPAWSIGASWGGDQIVWGTWGSDDQIVWGTWGRDDQIVWGTNLVWDDPHVWADSVVWGDRTIGTFNGDQIVWGTTGGLKPETVAWGNLEGQTGAANASSVR